LAIQGIVIVAPAAVPASSNLRRVVLNVIFISSVDFIRRECWRFMSAH
jgi:hypothetical protein